MALEWVWVLDFLLDEESVVALEPLWDLVLGCSWGLVLELALVRVWDSWLEAELVVVLDCSWAEVWGFELAMASDC